MHNYNHHPIPQKTKVSSLDDYRAVARSSVVMKVLERLVLRHMLSTIMEKWDPIQFAYRAKRSVNNVIVLALHIILQNLDSPNCYRLREC